MRQVISGLVMFVTGAAVAGALHELLRFHVQFAQTVDDDMYMDIPASVASIRMAIWNSSCITFCFRSVFSQE